MALKEEAKQQLDNFMEFYGLSQTDLACRMRPPVEKQTVMRWFDGSRTPSIAYQQQLFDMSDGQILLSSWLTEEELAREEARAAWFKKWKVQRKANGKLAATGAAGNGPRILDRVEKPVVGAVGRPVGNLTGNPTKAPAGKPTEKPTGNTNKINEQKAIASKNSNGQTVVSGHNGTGSVHGAKSGEQANGARIPGSNGVVIKIGIQSKAGIPASNEVGTTEQPVKRKPGRPKGSKNRPIVDVHAGSNGVRDGSGGADANKTRAGSRARSVRTSPAANSKSGKSGESSESAEGGEESGSNPGSIPGASNATSSDTARMDAGSAGGAAVEATVIETSAVETVAVETTKPIIEPRPSPHEENKASDQPAAIAVPVAAPTGPVRKNHAECSSDDPMTRRAMQRSGAIQFELVDHAGVVLGCYQDVVQARNALDSRIYPTSHAARCKFCWTEVSVYTPPRPEITERLARSVTEAQPRRTERDGRGERNGHERNGRSEINGRSERDAARENIRLIRERREAMRVSEDLDVGE